MTKRLTRPYRHLGSTGIQQANKRKQPGTTSPYFGVTWCKQHQQWVARMTIDYETKFICLSSSEEEAAREYLKKGIETYGPDFRIEDQIKLLNRKPNEQLQQAGPVSAGKGR